MYPLPIHSHSFTHSHLESVVKMRRSMSSKYRMRPPGPNKLGSGHDLEFFEPRAYKLQVALQRLKEIRVMMCAPYLPRRRERMTPSRGPPNLPRDHPTQQANTNTLHTPTDRLRRHAERLDQEKGSRDSGKQLRVGQGVCLWQVDRRLCCFATA
jgi:hypothetical protein